MNVYIETNFVLELALLQEQHESCRAILDLAADKRIQLIIPAYCLIEPNETVARRHRQRKQRKAELDEELRQLARNVQNRDRLEGFIQATALLIDSADDEVKRLQAICDEICEAGQIIPLDLGVLRAASVGRQQLGLAAQDALVYASVAQHLASSPAPTRCFLSRDSDFGDPDIVRGLLAAGCRLISNFDHGLQHISRNLA